MDDRELVFAAELCRVPRERRPEPLDVLAPGPVARLARDAELADDGARVRITRRRLARVLDARLGRGVVAEDAVRVPDRGVRVPGRIVRLEERAVHVHPALLADVPEER